MDREPLWKTLLNWGTVVTFFSMPLVMLSVQMYALTHPGWIQTIVGEKPHLDYLRDMQRNVTILVFGLAGLKTYEQIRNGKSSPEAENKSQTKIKLT